MLVVNCYGLLFSGGILKQKITLALFYKLVFGSHVGFCDIVSVTAM